VLWTPPHVDLDDPFESFQYRPSEAVRRYGGIAISVEEWESWRGRFADLPAPDKFPQTLRRDLLAAWRGEAPIFGRFDSPDRLVQVARERAVAADPSSLEAALAGLEAVAEWLNTETESPVEGKLVSVSSEDVSVETIYFDVPDTFDRPVLREWRPTARVTDAVSPTFGGELVLVPALRPFPLSSE
jgi:hypothetical protein